jgi:hypothetical protein
MRGEKDEVEERGAVEPLTTKDTKEHKGGSRKRDIEKSVELETIHHRGPQRNTEVDRETK